VHDLPAGETWSLPRVSDKNPTADLKSRKRLVFSESKSRLKVVDESETELAFTKEVALADDSQTETDLSLLDKEVAEFASETKYAEAERVSKYLSRSGVCSRREAERLIHEGLVRVNKKIIDNNMIINPLTDVVSIKDAFKPEIYPIKQDTKVWLFYKPMTLLCDERDPKKRPNIFDYVRGTTKIKEHLISVGR
jgi:ribosomal 50S subunit-recycling heat shock protein